MDRVLDRRRVTAALLGSAIAAPVRAGRFSDSTIAAHPAELGIARSQGALSSIEARGGGRLGVVAIDSGTGARIAHRAEERFPMCSTHKMLSGAAILSRVDAGGLALDRRVAFGQADLLDYAPVARTHVGAGFMTVEALGEAAVRQSDNTAANLLLRLLGGPAGWTDYARSIGDTVSRLDRIEPALNQSIVGDPRDTTTPSAMTASLAAVLFGTALTDGSRARLTRWMWDSDVTAPLFRAGIPADWHVADKSGAGENGSRNDIGILYPSDSAPILLSVFYTGSAMSLSGRNAVVARVAAIVADALRPRSRDRTDVAAGSPAGRGVR